MTLAPLFKSNAVLLFQTEHGNDSSQERIKKKMPRRVKKRRKVQTDDGVGDIVSFQFACLFAVLVFHYPSSKLSISIGERSEPPEIARSRVTSCKMEELARKLISTRFFIARPLPVFTNLLDD